MVSSTLNASCKRTFTSSIYSDKGDASGVNLVHEHSKVSSIHNGLHNRIQHRCKMPETLNLTSVSIQLPGAKVSFRNGGSQLPFRNTSWCGGLIHHKTESHSYPRKVGVNSAFRSNVATEEAGEEVTEDEESFHKHTTRDGAYWDSVMQAITMDASAPPEQRFENLEKGAQNETVVVGNVEKQSRGNLKNNFNRAVKHSQEGEASEQQSGTWKDAVSTEVKVSLKQLLQFERQGESAPFSAEENFPGWMGWLTLSCLLPPPVNDNPTISFMVPLQAQYPHHRAHHSSKVSCVLPGHVLVRQLVPEEAMEEIAEEIWAAAREQELDAYRHRVRTRAHLRNQWFYHSPSCS